MINETSKNFEVSEREREKEKDISRIDADTNNKDATPAVIALAQLPAFVRYLLLMTDDNLQQQQLLLLRTIIICIRKDNCGHGAAAAAVAAAAIWSNGRIG